MKQSEMIAERLMRNFEILKMTLADFSDADMFVRPAPGANHAAWQLGHVIQSETAMVKGASDGQTATLPAAIAEKILHKRADSDDAAAFATKDELLDIFAQVRETSAKWVRSLSDEQMDAPAPEQIRFLAPTVAQMAVLMAEHTCLHIGQFQVIRRVLGKPVLF